MSNRCPSAGLSAGDPKKPESAGPDLRSMTNKKPATNDECLVQTCCLAQVRFEEIQANSTGYPPVLDVQGWGLVPNRSNMTCQSIQV